MALAVTIQHTSHNSGPIPFKLDISTEFKNNQINALFGPSGAGKTSLLRVVAGLEKKANAANDPEGLNGLITELNSICEKILNQLSSTTNNQMS